MNHLHSIQQFLHRYDSTIWIRVIGTIMTTMANFMVRPFLTLYLFSKLDGNLLLTTLIIGLQPATGLIAGLLAGEVADRYGRKPVMVLALLLEAFSVIGYIFADSVLTFALLTIVNGIGGTLFQPAAQAQVTDVVPEERRSEVFALLHSALNLGVACGPLLGVVLYKISPTIGFVICASALLLFCLLVLWKIKETLPQEVRQQALQAKGQPKAKQHRLRFGEHKLVFGIVLAYLPFTLLYSQIESILPQHLKHNFTDYLSTYATILTINGTMVAICQLFIARFADRFPVHRVICAAFLIVACTAFGYGWSTSFLPLVISELFFTIGEMMNGPVIQKAVSIMAPTEMRGRYFAIFGAGWGISGMIGPILGALAFTHLGGAYWFSIIGLLLVVAAFIQRKLLRAAIQQPDTASHLQNTQVQNQATL
ncbi:MAG: MDR family MFS transporter [Tumebacillaceae bacterium]